MIGFQLEVPREVELREGATLKCREVLQGGRTLGELEVSVFAAALVIDQVGQVAITALDDHFHRRLEFRIIAPQVVAYLIVFRPSNGPAPVVSNMALQPTADGGVASATVDGQVLRATTLVEVDTWKNV